MIWKQVSKGPPFAEVGPSAKMPALHTRDHRCLWARLPQERRRHPTGPTSGEQPWDRSTSSRAYSTLPARAEVKIRAAPRASVKRVITQHLCPEVTTLQDIPSPATLTHRQGTWSRSSHVTNQLLSWKKKQPQEFRFLVSC